MENNIIKLGIRQKELRPEEVVCFEGDVNYTKIYFASGKINMIAFTLKNIEGQLSGNQSFCRVHKSFIVNLNYVQQVEKTEIMLQNQKRILLSRRKRKLNLDRLSNI
jgi:DNA-binding LytR/AlgR family response regulator